MLPPAGSALTPALKSTSVRSADDPSLVSRATTYVFPAVSVAFTAPVSELVEDSSRLTTRVWPAATPDPPTGTVVVVRLVEAVAEPTRPTYAAAEGPWGVADASLDCGDGPAVFTADTL